MLLHSFEPQILDSVSEDHPLYGRDLRTIPDVRLAEGAARALLPGFHHLWRHLWTPHAVAPDASPVSEAEVLDLCSSVLRRISRILVQHAHIKRILPGPGAGEPSGEVSGEVLDAVTLAYVHMAGAFDALAVINGLRVGLTHYPGMGWQKPRFRTHLRPHVPGVVALMEPDTVGGKFLRAVLTFRNTIHNRMPDLVTTGRAGGDPQLRAMSLQLERRSHGDIFDAFEHVGWTKFAGVQPVGDYLLLGPGSAMRLMLSGGVSTLNQLMHAMPVEVPPGLPLTLDPNKSLYPPQLGAYAIEYLGLQHLVG